MVTEFLREKLSTAAEINFCKNKFEWNILLFFKTKH